MTSLLLALFAVVGVSAQSTSPPFVNVGAYTIVLRSLYGGALYFNLSVTVVPTPTETLVQTFAQAPYYYGGSLNTTMVSNMGLYGGVMAWTDMPMRNLTGSSCVWVQNVTLSLFDFTANGWLAQANVTRFQSQILYTYDCSPNCASTQFSSSSIYKGLGFYQLTTDLAGNYLSLSTSNSQYFLFITSPTKLNAKPTFPVPSPCVTGDRCPANATSQSITLFRNHGNSTLFKQLDNVNLADAQGEVYWLCDYTSGSPLISQFKLTVNPAWTDYMLCNGGLCPSTSFGGRLGIGKQNNGLSDKCSDAPIANRTCSNRCGGVGSWYAFPTAGRCPPNKPIGTNNCTWLDKYVTVKTITVDCLRQNSINNFTCTNQTITDLTKQFLNAFKVCDDVQVFLKQASPIEDATLPLISHRSSQELERASSTSENSRSVQSQEHNSWKARDLTRRRLKKK